jgi:hypothetical protein
MIAGQDTSIPPIGLEPPAHAFGYRTGFALGRVPMLTNLTRRNVAVLIAVIVMASGCIAWVIIIATDQTVA